VDSDYRMLRIRDLETGQLLQTLSEHTDWVTAAAVTQRAPPHFRIR
jgi:hypothetical protein